VVDTLPASVPAAQRFTEARNPATRQYTARRVAEGKSSRGAVRLLKRYLPRHLYRVMQNSPPLTT
jgi:hypothetical protein